MNLNLIALLKLLTHRHLLRLRHGGGAPLLVEIIDIHEDGACDLRIQPGGGVLFRIPATRLERLVQLPVEVAT